MNLCSDGHEEVCFECRRCPACEEKSKANVVSIDLREAQERIKELEDLITGN